MPSERPDTTVISVRADAHRSVDPDSVSLHVHLHGSGGTKVASREAVDTSLRQITDALAGSGGAIESADVHRRALTWRVQSAHSNVHHDDRGRPTGSHETYLSIVIRVRDFTLLGIAETAIAAVDDADLSTVSWHVDDDNPAWPLVRADAIRSALSRGRDYAAAIGGEVISLEQVSDVGLLGGTADRGIVAVSARADMWMEQSDDMSAGLEPVPQRISATIEARLRATVGSLPG